MEIIRFLAAGSTAPRVGVAQAGTVTELGAGSLAELLAEPLTALRQLCEQAAGPVHARGEVRLLAPVDGRTEVWAAGVTYELSQRERMKESVGAAVFYQQVYDAARPELFFKSVSWRVAGPGQPIAVRADSAIDVPEPELALVLNSRAEIVGYSICNDVSSRTIEGENPLYLPQAKIYLGGCALGPAIRPAWEVPDPYALGIQLTIAQDGATIWDGTASTASLHRRLDDLVEHLYRAEVFPGGAVLSTGTCLVPELPFTLTDGDLVTIAIEEIGALANPVVRGRLDWPLPPPA
jgi:2-dehydro-3-deoxy-D-arabinonate dehydratase